MPIVTTFRPYAATEAKRVPEKLVEAITAMSNKYARFECFEVVVFKVPDDDWAGPTFSYETVWVDKPHTSFADFSTFLNWLN